MNEAETEVDTLIEYENYRNIDKFTTNNGFIRVLNITNMLVLQETIYILADNYGIKIVDVYTFGFVKYDFVHKNLKNFDLVVNPLLNTKYVGITLGEEAEQDEFLIELNVDQERYPLINKIFISNVNVSTQLSIVNDLFLHIFYNNQDNSLIIIRRGLLNEIPHLTYKYKLEGNVTVGNFSNLVVQSLYNPSSELNEFFLIDNENKKAYVFANFAYDADTMECKFKDQGNYNVTLEKFGEACEDSLKHSYAYSYCDYIIYLNFRAIGEDMTNLTVMGIVLGTLCGFIVLLITFFLLVKTQCCKDMSMFTGKKGKAQPSREELYVDNYIKKKKYEQKFIETDQQSITKTEKKNTLENNNGSRLSAFSYNEKR
mmetsp:Transcript_17897/g.18556  ORF Transcript_17897/g.18556 Transcript_17897/m.18556 type:complete len:371 (-) Transcript_17897:32-1144(-)